jgi:hypothetical protein
MYPPHFVHFTMDVAVNLPCASERLFHLQPDNCLVWGYRERMSAEETKQPRSPLLDLAVKYFKKEGFKVNAENAMMEGHSGVMRHFDLVVQKGRLEQGVWVRDWNRTIGVNVIINLDTASEDVDLASPIMIGEKFSDHAKSYSNRRKISLLTKQKIGSFR